jgi:hypothetical protein
MSAKAKCLKLASECGCTVDDDGSAIEIVLPRGKMLNASECHRTGISYRDGWGTVLMPKSEAWEALLADLQDGLTDCTDPECEECEATK